MDNSRGWRMHLKGNYKCCTLDRLWVDGACNCGRIDYLSSPRDLSFAVVIVAIFVLSRWVYQWTAIIYCRHGTWTPVCSSRSCDKGKKPVNQSTIVRKLYVYTLLICPYPLPRPVCPSPCTSTHPSSSPSLSFPVACQNGCRIESEKKKKNRYDVDIDTDANRVYPVLDHSFSSLISIVTKTE